MSCADANKVANALENIKNNSVLSVNKKLHALFDAVLSLTYHNDEKMCLGGMFASDLQSLPVSIQNKARTFF